MDKRTEKLVNMHWYMWEAVYLEVTCMSNHGILPEWLVKEADSICSETRDGGRFTVELRQRAVEVDAAIDQYRELCNELNMALMDEAEAHDREALRQL